MSLEPGWLWPYLCAALLLSYVAYLGQIAIHNCVHCTLFSYRPANRWFGVAIGSLLLVGFEGWRAAHLMHHGYCNQERDPHRVDRPLIPYLLTHYYRITRAVWSPRKHLTAIAPPLVVAAGIIGWQATLGHAARGVFWVTVFWFIPVVVSHLLVAHFNYITHVGLPPGRGRNTRDFTTGLWPVVNFFTFGFYRHAQHHLHPTAPVPPRVASVTEPAGNG